VGLHNTFSHLGMCQIQIALYINAALPCLATYLLIQRLSVEQMEISFSRYARDLGASSPEELSSLFVHSEYTEDEKKTFLEMMDL